MGNLNTRGKVRLALAAGEPQVVDVRGKRGITAWFGGGVTVEATPVDDVEGTAIANAAAESMTSGTMLDVSARYYSVEATGGTAVVHVIE